MAATRLSLYNNALMNIGERALDDLNTNSEGRVKLDEVWNNGGVQRCLEAGLWRFATRTQELQYDPNIQTNFGFGYGFTKPTDWMRTINVASDGFFKVPLVRYMDENGFIFCDLPTIYVRFTSNDADYGMNLSLWTGKFAEYVEWYFANRIVRKITQDQKMADAIQHPTIATKGLLPAALLTAKNLDAWADPVKFPARGNWVNARIRNGNNGGSWADGGSQNQLIG